LVKLSAVIIVHVCAAFLILCNVASPLPIVHGVFTFTNKNDLTYKNNRLIQANNSSKSLTSKCV